MKKIISNWGNYPEIEAERKTISTTGQLKQVVEMDNSFIARGMGRCYGDASLNETVISTLNYNKFLSFDSTHGVIDCQAGVSLAEVLDVVVPKGWFLPVTPGTKYITVGGAVASDIHGKNHHVDGTFGEHVKEMDILTGDEILITCSPQQYPDLFEATCGGMGLTGVITRVQFSLKKIETCYIKEKKIKAANLDEIFNLFQQHQHVTYSVAWIDCLKKGKNFGRSILMLGEHAKVGELINPQHKKNPLIKSKDRSINFPFYLPGFALNKFSIKLFNEVFYGKQLKKETESIIPYTPFFYPLDAIQNWNRMYGKRGFIQYQTVFPLSVSKEALTEMLHRISEKGFGSFLAVLKLFGKQDSLISFPMEGYTLALDFPVKDGLFPFLDELDELVLKYNGRIYLSKDARMNKTLLEQTYPNLEKFKSIIAKYNPANKFTSVQSRRLFDFKEENKPVYA